MSPLQTDLQPIRVHIYGLNMFFIASGSLLLVWPSLEFVQIACNHHSD